jgi:hypothetical protein
MGDGDDLDCIQLLAVNDAEREVLQDQTLCVVKV